MADEVMTLLSGKKPARRVYQDERLILTITRDDGTKVTVKSTGVDNRGRHYFTASDHARADFKRLGKVPFNLSQGLPIDYAGSDSKGRADLLTKEVSDDVINRRAAELRAAYEATQEAKDKEKREKAKAKTKRKLKTVPGGSTRGGGGSLSPSLKLITDKLPKLSSGGKVHRGRRANYNAN